MTRATDLTNPVTPAHRPATSQDFAPQKKFIQIRIPLLVSMA